MKIIAENDIYIVAMKYGYANLEKGVTHTEVKEYLESKGFKFETKQSKHHFDRIFTSIFSEPRGKSWKNHNEPNGDDFICYLNEDAYFKLLEYEELKNAQKSALSATRFAIIAIIISIIVAGFSIYYSNKQLNSPIVIEKSQLKEITNKENIENQLEKIISNQEKLVVDQENKRDTLSNKK